VNATAKKTKEAPQAKALEIVNAEGKKVGELAVDKHCFDGNVNRTLLYQVTTMYRANQRQGTASTKTRAYVRGGGKKPWRQKGTGRARVGSIRSPLWKGGGIVFGPHPKDYTNNEPKKMKKRALAMALDAKIQGNELVVMDALNVQEPKTRVLYTLIKKVCAPQHNTILVVDAIDKNLKLASRNIPYFMVKIYQELNALEVLQARKVIITKNAFEKLTTVLREDVHATA